MAWFSLEIYLLCLGCSIFVFDGTDASNETTSSLVCTDSQFPCDNDSQCVEKKQWCDSKEDCLDDSDERYCSSGTSLNADPNHCGTHHFRCGNGPCIPLSGYCDGFVSCADRSDEADCQMVQSPFDSITSRFAETTPSSLSSSESPPPSTSLRQVTQRPTTESNEVLNISHFYWHPRSILSYPDGQDELEKYASRINLAKEWLLSQWNAETGWDEETSRAILALYFADPKFFAEKSEKSTLISTQFQLKLSLDLLKNKTKAIESFDLAHYINAMMAQCYDPRSFYGLDLVHSLRMQVDESDTTSISPLVYLTLCIANATTYSDVKKVGMILTDNSPFMERLDTCALVALAASCIVDIPKYASIGLREAASQHLLQKLATTGIPADIYTSALVIQALRATETDEKLWNTQDAMDLILDRQINGSFGDVLATYYVLPVLTGRSLLSLRYRCGSYKNSLPSLNQALKDDWITVQYSIYLHYPLQESQTLKLQVPKDSNILDLMRLAQEISPSFRFECDESRTVPVVYSLGGRSNDAERGLHWTLYFTQAANASSHVSSLRLPFSKDLRKTVLHAGDHAIFWLKN